MQEESQESPLPALELLPQLLMERTVTSLSDVARLSADQQEQSADIADVYRRQCELRHAVLARVCLRQLRDSKFRFCFYYPQSRDAAALLRAVQLNTNLLELNLKDNGFDSKQKLSCLGELLETHGNVAKLDLSRNSLQPEAFACLHRSLMAGTPLVCLRLSRCSLSDADGLLLCHLLAKDKHLEYLDVSGNSLGGQTAAALAAALQQNSYLIDLNISWNTFTSSHVVSLAQGLACHTELRRLACSSNGAEDAGLAALLSAASREGSQLRVLEASDCRVSHRSAQQLARFLKARPQFHALKLNRSLFREEDLLLLLRAVPPESQLLLLEMNNVSRSAAITAATPPGLRLTLRLEREVKVKTVAID